MLEDLQAPAIVLATSLLAYFLGRRSTRQARASVKIALARFFECLGAFIVFFAINVTLIFVLSLLVRTLGSRFISFYIAHDIMLLILSAAQAVFFSFWWHSK